MASAETESGADSAIELSIPASSAYLGLVRAATSGVCARSGFTLDRLDDVTLAMNEAVALLLGDTVLGSQLRCRWTMRPQDLVIRVTSVSSSGRVPRKTTFAWTVLSALVDEVDSGIDADEVTLTLRVRTGPPAAS